MKKSKKIILIVIISILSILVLGLGGYIIWNDFLNEKDNGNINTSTTTTTKSNSKENIIHTDTFTYNINNKNKEVKFVYIKESGESINERYFPSKDDVECAKENGEYVYDAIYLKIFVNDVEVEGVKILVYYNTELGNKKFTEFYKKKIIKKFIGADKEYFVFVIRPINDIFSDPTIVPIVVNENGKLLYKIKFQDYSGIFPEDKTSRFYNLEYDGSSGSGQFIVAKDKIYFIKPMCDIPEKYLKDNVDYLIGEYSSLIQEYILTVDNDVVNIEQGEVYIGSGGGAVPECN